MSRIRAGTVADVNTTRGEWVYVDMGFSDGKRSCGFLADGDDDADGPEELTFAELQARLTKRVSTRGGPLNLVLEAPLSVAFSAKGNPTWRDFERRPCRKGPCQTRYWYVGLGCAVLVATTYLLRSLVAARPKRDVRLFEGFVSFKAKEVARSHKQDVEQLRAAARDKSVVRVNKSATRKGVEFRSAFEVAGMDFGLPPVILVTDDQTGGRRTGTERSRGRRT